MAYIEKEDIFPQVPISHQISLLSEDIVSLQFNPWIVNIFPAQRDYGIDGDTKITCRREGKITPEVLPWSFQFQIKATENKEIMKVAVKTKHLKWWLYHNIPTFLLFVRITHKIGDIYWLCINEALYDEIMTIQPDWKENDSITIHFEDKDKFDDTNPNSLISAIKNWKRPLNPDNGVVK